MPISLTNVEAMPTLATYESDVQIFKNTKAVEIPAKLDAVADDFKSYMNDELKTPVENYMNDELFVKLQQAITDIEQGFNDGYENLTLNLAGYTSTVTGYTVESANKGLFTGNNVGLSKKTIQDENGNLTQWYSNGVLRTIVYDDEGLPTTGTETININGVDYTKNYSFTIDTDLNMTITEEL